VSKATDLKELTQLADRIDDLQALLAKAVERRRIIWQRRLDAGDVSKAELARVSRCGPMNVTHGLKVTKRRAARAERASA
jgi:hypothetical protein